MVGYVRLEEQVDVDFTRARRKALLGRTLVRLRRDAALHRPLCLQESQKDFSWCSGRNLSGWKDCAARPDGGVKTEAHSTTAQEKRTHRPRVGRAFSGKAAALGSEAPGTFPGLQ